MYRLFRQRALPWRLLRWSWSWRWFEGAREKPEFDRFRVKNHNPVFDLTILVQTVEVVLFGRGAR